MHECLKMKRVNGQGLRHQMFQLLQKIGAWHESLRPIMTLFGKKAMTNVFSFSWGYEWI
jgi:hypothetical protein